MKLPEGILMPKYIMSIEDMELNIDKIDEILKTKIDHTSMVGISEQIGEIIE